jgi:hypothetical protein
VADENPFKRQAAEQRDAFKNKHGYRAQRVPNVWVGQSVALNLLGPARASGMLEAVKPHGYVLSVEDRIVFIPRESVLQLELYNPDEHGSRLRLERDILEPADPSDPGTIGTE